MGKCVHYLDGISGGEIDYQKFWKFSGILCTLYMYGMFGFEEKLNIQKRVNSTGNCVHYMYRISGFAEKLNVKNFVNSARKYVHYICTEYLDLQRNWISWNI